MQAQEIAIDVTEAADLGEEATVSATITFPDTQSIGPETVICFGKPGGGYSKGYFTVDLPGPGTGAQADWHAQRGWLFVSIDHLGVGSSSTHHAGARLDYTTLAAANQSAELEILRRLAEGSLNPDFPAVTPALRLGIGQSMGGCLTVIQQGRYHCYDGIGVLGYSAIHTHPPAKPGEREIGAAWLPRDTLIGERMVIVNSQQLHLAEVRSTGQNVSTSRNSQADGTAMGWGFFYDDIDEELVTADLTEFPTRNGNVPPWASATLPMAVAASCLTPGAVAPEAAAVRSPVLVGMGERDVIPNPSDEMRAYKSSQSVDLFVCPRMGHMHNFAGTRELLWQRIDTWASWVAYYKRNVAAG